MQNGYLLALHIRRYEGYYLPEERDFPAILGA